MLNGQDGCVVKLLQSLGNNTNMIQARCCDVVDIMFRQRCISIIKNHKKWPKLEIQKIFLLELH